VSARGARTGLRSTAAALLLAALAGGALAACGHYGPPLRAEEYREKQKAERAEKQRRRQEQSGAVDAPVSKDQEQTAPGDDQTGGAPAPEPGVGPLEGEEAP
jgi:hypothetical protein